MDTASNIEIYEPPETIYRADDYNDRYYYKPKGNSIEWYISTTTWLKRVMPMSPGLIRWMKKNDEDFIDNTLEKTSAYGTFMHTVFNSFIHGDTWDSSKEAVQERIQTHCEIERIPCGHERIDKWSTRIQKDLRALLAFIDERNVRLIASELMLAGQVNGLKYAGALDLVCEFEFNGSNVTALVDYKSGSLWDEHVYQLIAYKKLWDLHYPNRGIDYIFNWRPKDWRSSPSYQLKNRTGKAKEVSGKFDRYLEIAAMEIEPEPKPDFEFEGELDLETDVTDTYKKVTATERELQKFN